jgi:hypothetical protein
MYTLNKHSRTARDFDTWRQNHRTRFKHIPLPLWEQVIALSQVFPIAQISKHLRLCGNDLKKRCGAPPAAMAEAAPSTALGVVEVTSPPALPLPTPATEIDLRRAAGARLRIICQAFQVPLAVL